MPVLDALVRKNGFTKTEEVLANYVIDNPDAVTGMNVSELARASFTSNATIVRLCHKLGLDGYRDFRIQLVADLERMRATERDINPDTPFLEGQGTRAIISSVASLKKRAIDETYATLAPIEVQRAARLILAARRTAIYAVGDSAITAEGFSNLLLKIGITCFMANQHGDSFVLTSSMGPRDVALVVSYSGRQFQRLSREVQIAREHGSKIIAVTSDATVRDRMADLGALILLPSGESVRNRIATYYAQTCIRYALECVYGECFSENYGENVERVSRYDDVRPEPGER